MTAGGPMQGICRVDEWANVHEYPVDGWAEVVGYHVDGCIKVDVYQIDRHDRAEGVAYHPNQRRMWKLGCEVLQTGMASPATVKRHNWSAGKFLQCPEEDKVKVLGTRSEYNQGFSLKDKSKRFYENRD
ncbi:hypothetical protein BDR07DRAFT_1464764 [Suillus spraguei]|nr:hypothetical protein BDR07DRAFT_1464764 [Suillus spraguei]